MSCIFCQKELDGSDEHIIPDSLNGRMHSKKIICHDCNSNVFGKHVDPIGKEFFNPLLVAFQFKNARSIYVYDANGEHFVHDRQGNIKMVKPKVVKTKVANQTKLEVTGDPVNAIKKFKKEAENIEKHGKKRIKAEIKGIAHDSVPFKSEKVFEPNKKLKLLFNKIAFEYLAYKGMDVSPYQETLAQIRNIDVSIDNVKFCNENLELRNFNVGELTHLIKPFIVNNNLIVYIELFNILCGCVLIDDKFEGNLDIETYYQNTISGEKIDNEVTLNQAKLEQVLEADAVELENIQLGNLIRRALGVQQELELQTRLKEESDKGIKEIKELLDKGEITQADYDERSMHVVIQAMAKLSIEEFPYMFDDIPDEMDNQVHYIHSNLREEQFEEFCSKNNRLIGKGIIDPENKKFMITGFEHFPVTIKNGISIVKVFVVIEGETGIHRIPYKEVFEMEPTNEPNE